jgi:hypothetical protein
MALEQSTDSPLVRCRNCGRGVAKGVGKCPNCGGVPVHVSMGQVLGGVAGVIFLIWFAIYVWAYLMRGLGTA